MTVNIYAVTMVAYRNCIFPNRLLCNKSGCYKLHVDVVVNMDI